MANQHKNLNHKLKLYNVEAAVLHSACSNPILRIPNRRDQDYFDEYDNPSFEQIPLNQKVLAYMYRCLYFLSGPKFLVPFIGKCSKFYRRILLIKNLSKNPFESLCKGVVHYIVTLSRVEVLKSKSRSYITQTPEIQGPNIRLSCDTFFEHYQGRSWWHLFLHWKSKFVTIFQACQCSGIDHK